MDIRGTLDKSDRCSRVRLLARLLPKGKKIKKAHKG